MARRFTPTLAADVDGMRFYVSTTDMGVGRNLFSGVQPDRASLERAVGAIAAAGLPGPSGRVLVEVGANIGTTTVMATRAYGFREVICFEPVPANRELLVQNLSLNGVQDRVRVVPVALSSSPGTANLALSPINAGAARVRARRSEESGIWDESRWEVIEVPTDTFDSFVERGDIDLADVALVWMDVQGHEWAVLEGARTLRESAVPVVIEFWPYGLRRAGALERLLALLKTEYTRILDLTLADELSDWVEYSPSDIDELTRTYTGASFTDLLLIR
jgi:FkbM family methyltransferase